MAWDFSNGLLGMGGFGGGGNNMPANSLLGEFYNPAEARKYQLKQMLLGLGAGLMAEKGMGKGAALALAAGDRAGTQYRDNAFDAYKLKTAQDEQAYQRQQDAEQAKRQAKQDAMQSTLFQHQLEGWQKQEDQQAAADQAWSNIRNMPSTGVPVQNYALADQFYKMGRPDDAIQTLMPPTPKQAQAPAAIQEYEYARSQGFPGTFQDWEASKKGGMSLSVDPATGQVTFQQGSNIKPMTESQSKDTVYATRAEGALNAFEPVANALTGVQGATLGAIPGVGNYMKPQDYQKAEQAGREFLAAILRKDSGGAITKEEVNEYGTVYLPAPGDGPEVLLQKKESRQRAVAALKAGMTPQAILAQEQALKQGQTAGSNATQNIRKYNPQIGKFE